MPLQDFPIWRRPRHHMDVEGASDHVHWVELFFDLIHVVTVFIMGGLSLFALAWINFDSAGNAKPRSRATPVLLAYWFAHMTILWSAILIGVALAGEVYVGFREPYPTGYGAIGTVGLAVFLASLWVLQLLVEGRGITCRYHSGGVRLFGRVSGWPPRPFRLSD